MMLEQIADKQRRIAERIEAANDDKRKLVQENREVLRRIRAEQDNTSDPNYDRLRAVIGTAIEEGILPSARRGETHEDGATTVGLLIEAGWKQRAMEEAVRRGIVRSTKEGPVPSYRAMVMACFRVGLNVMEQIPVETPDTASSQ